MPGLFRTGGVALLCRAGRGPPCSSTLGARHHLVYPGGMGTSLPAGLQLLLLPILERAFSFLFFFADVEARALPVHLDAGREK